MRIDRGLLNWGVFLVTLGGVPLAVQQGWVDSSLAGDLWRLWPLILIGIGLGLILRWTPIAWLGGALVAATFGLIFGALLAVGVSGISSACIGVGEEGETTSRSGPASTTAFAVDLTLSCGELTLVREAGATWSVEAHHGRGSPPAIEASTSGIDVRQGFSSDAFLVFTQERRNDWTVSVPAVAALDLGLTLNAGDARVDVGSGTVGRVDGTFNASDGDLDFSAATAASAARFDLTYNASSGKVALPAAALSGEITLNASSLSLCLPQGADVRVEHDGTLSSADFRSSDLVEVQDDVWRTDGGSGDPMIDLLIESTVSSVVIAAMEECG